VLALLIFKRIRDQGVLRVPVGMRGEGSGKEEPDLSGNFLVNK